MPNETAAPAQVTTLAHLRQPEPAEARMPMVRTGFDNLQSWELMQRQCKALAASTLVPTQYQNNLPNCLIALEMAQRIGASPLMVMQNLYIVHGRPGWSAVFMIASFNQCGRFSAVRFNWSGARDKDDWSCQAWATEKSTGEKITGPLISIALAKKEGWYDKSSSKWKTIPELMLMYRAAAWMVRTHAPEISMGLNTAEEIADVYDATRGAGGDFEVTIPELQQQQQGAGTEQPDTPEVQKARIAGQIAACTSVEAIDLALDSASELPPELLAELRKEAEAARERLQPKAKK